MAPKEHKINKQAAAGITRDITLTIPETTEIIRKLGNATSQSVIMAANKIGLMTIYGMEKHKGKITCKNLVQYRYCLINGILNNVAPLKSCGRQIK
jgi:hypothetical protein